MGSSRNWYDIGNEIRTAVQDSLRTGDFADLGDVISDTVSDVVDEAKRLVKTANDKSQDQQKTWQSKTTYQYTTNTTKKQQTNERHYTYRYAPNGQAIRYERRQGEFRPPRVLFQRKGGVSGILYTVFGGIGTGLSAVGLIAFILVSVFVLGPTVGVLGSAGIAALMAGCIGMIAKGAANRRRLHRAERYYALCNNHTYVNISELAAQTGKSQAFVRKDVKRMMAIGMFPQGHLDEQENCLMLSDDTYREYLAIEKQRRAMDAEEIVKQHVSAGASAGTANGAGNQGTSAKSDTRETESEKTIWRALSGIEDPTEEISRDNPELADMIRQGQECTGHIRQMNDRIPGEVISEKLSALENVLKEIFDRVREHPEQMGKMKKFMDYYLPTTRKLVEAYEEFDSALNPNDEIISAKLEIEKTIDTINQSFVELLNQMYQDSVFDATTDAKVLQTMLAKDGLARDHAFDSKR